MAEHRPRGNRLIKNSVLNLLNSGLTMVFTFVTSIVVARTLKPENFGIFNLVLWFSGLCAWAVSMGLTQAVTKYVAEYTGRRETVELSSIVRFVMRIELTAGLLVTVVLLFFRTSIADYFFSPNEAFYFLIAFVGLVPGLTSAVFCSAIEGIQKFEYFTYFHLIVTPLSFAAKLAVILLGYHVNGLLVVTLVFSFINAFFFWRILRREGFALGLFGDPLRKDIRKKLLRYNFSVAAIGVADKVVWDKSENFFLGRFSSATQIGYYNLAFNVAQRFMSVLPSTFWRVLFPAMSEYFGSGDQSKIRRLFYLSSRYLAFFAFPVGVAGALLSWPILRHLYGHDYIEAKVALQIIFLASIVSSLSKPGSAILYGTERQGFIFRYGMALAGINILLDFLLIPRYGAVGAAICWGSVTTAGAVGGLIYTCRTMNLHYPFRSVFKIIFSTILMAVSIMLVYEKKDDLFGFLMAVATGAAVYVVSSLVLGSFEQEDYTVLRSIRRVLPDWAGRPADAVMDFLMDFKTADKIPFQNGPSARPPDESSH